MAGAARRVRAGSSDAVTRTASRRAPLLVAKAPKMSRRRSGAAGACRHTALRKKLWPGPGGQQPQNCTADSGTQAAKFHDVSEGARRKVLVAIAIGEHQTTNTGLVQGSATVSSAITRVGRSMPLDRVVALRLTAVWAFTAPALTPTCWRRFARRKSTTRGGASDDAARLALFEAEQAARVAELIEQWRGAPVLARSYELPRGVALQRHFRGAPRSFVVTPDDIVRLRPKGTRP